VSLHVTVGINQLTWRGLVRRAIQPVLDAVPDDHLPAGYLESRSDVAGELADRLQELADAVRGVDAGAAVDAEVRRFLTTRSPRLPGGLTDVLAARDVDDDTVLRRRSGHPCVLIERGDRLDVLLGDRALDVPAWLRPALEEIRAREQLRSADLSEVLDAQSRLVLCRRLIREGLLEVVG
jgi:hypothetical protein